MRGQVRRTRRQSHRLNSVGFQNVRNRRNRDCVPEILERTLDASVTPARIFPGRLQSQAHGLLRNRGPSYVLPPPAEVPMPRNKLPMPTQDRIWSNDAASCSSIFLPRILPLTANRRRWSSLSKIRFFTGFCRSTRFLVTLSPFHDKITRRRAPDSRS